MKSKKISVRFLSITLLCLFTLASSVEVYADATTNWRTTDCRWWRKKYRATAKIAHWLIVINPFPTCFRTAGNCGGIIPQNASTCSDACGVADAYVFPINSSPLSENDIRKQEQEIRAPTTFPCWLGDSPSNLYTDIGRHMGLPKSSASDKDELSVAKFDRIENINANTREFTIKQGNGIIKMRNDDYSIVEMRFTIWRPNDDYANNIEDTVVTAQKTIVEEYIRIKAGVVEISSGLLNNPAITIYNDGTYSVVEINDLNYTYQIANNENISDLAVYSHVKSCPDDTKMVNFAIAKSKEKEESTGLTCKIYPNPSSDFIVVEMPKQKNVAKVEVKIFTIDGKLVKSKTFNDLLGANDKLLLELDVSDLLAGEYVVNILINDDDLRTNKITIIR